jgi:hypothetical protein
VPKAKSNREVIHSVINYHEKKSKKEIAQVTIKIDKKIDNALGILSGKLHISKNRLIEDIILHSGIIEEVDENYIEESV